MDERWKDMSASIGEPDFDIDNNWPRQGEWVEYRIDVHFSDQLFYCVQLLTQDDLRDIQEGVDVEKWIFEEMIKMIDVAMDHWQKTGEHCVF